MKPRWKKRIFAWCMWALVIPVSAAEFNSAGIKALGDGEFQFSSDGKTVMSEFIPVDPEHNYLLTGEFRAEEKCSGFSFGLMLYTRERRLIAPHSVRAVAGTEAKLVKPAKKGDFAIVVDDASAWKLPQGKIAALGVRPELADLPAGTFAYYITAITPDADGYRIEFSRPLPTAVSSGVMVRQHCDARNFSVIWKGTLGCGWTPFRRLISAGAQYTTQSDRWWPGVRFARIFISAPEGSRILFRRVELKPVAGDELNMLLKARRIAGEEVRPFGKYRSGGSGTEIEVQPGGGFYKAQLQWPTAETRQIEMQLKTDAPGMFELIWAGRDENGRRFNGRQVHPVIPDGNFHWHIFTLKPDATASGVITNLQMTWRSDVPTRMDITGLNARSRENLIPGPEALIPGRAQRIDYAQPRSRYRLRWVGGANPGVRISWFDRNGRPNGDFRLPPGTETDEFTMPATALRGEIVVEKAADGYPELTPVEAAETTAAFWRGQWIWCRNGRGPEWTEVWFEREFDLPDAPVETATLAIAADDYPWVFLNGEQVGHGGTFLSAKRFDVTELLRPGGNKLTIRVRNGSQEGGLLCDLYFRCGGRDGYLSTDREWKFRIGTQEMPDDISSPAVVLGDAATTQPWAGKVDYCYAGPRGKLKILSSAPGEFSAEVLTPPPALPRFLQARAVAPDGSERKVMLDAAIRREGNRMTVNFPPPYSNLEQPQTLYLDDDRLFAVGDAAIGTIPPSRESPGLSMSRFADVGGRPRLVVDNREHSPIFWAFNSAIFRNPAAQVELMAEAREAGFRNLVLLTEFPEFWTGPDQFDFSKLDERAAIMLDQSPDAVLLLQIGCYMPDWWLRDNPDEVTAHADGSPRNPMRESQALASKKWLRDAEVPLRALVRHIAGKPWGRRVWGASVSENRNWEWFWTITGKDNRPTVSGYSPGDLAAFRGFLRRKYRSDAELAAAWKMPEATLDAAQMPPPETHHRGRIGALLDPEQDRRLMDWFEFRNLALAEAIISLCGTIKSETDGRWLTGAYYGYFVEMGVNPGRSIHDHGHNGFSETAKSPEIDFVRAPTRYLLRRIGRADGIMQAQDTYTLRNKVVYVECDLRTAYRRAGLETYVSHPATGAETVAMMNRSFGMALAAGVSLYWYDIMRGSFREPVLRDLLKEQNDLYRRLPPVRGLTPRDVAVVVDRDSAYRTKRNADDGVMPAVIGPLFNDLNTLSVSYRVLSTDELLDGSAPPHRFYIMADAFSLSREQREALMRRFAAEKAAVLWLYAPGAFYPERGPRAEYCGDFLGLKTEMLDRKFAPVLKPAPGWGSAEYSVPGALSPWFYPVSGFDEVIGRDGDGRPALVAARRDGAVHYFSTLPSLPSALLRQMASRAGAHIYTPHSDDPLWAGNDVIFIHTRTGGQKQVLLPSDSTMRGIVGMFKGREFRSGEPWVAEPGQTYGFLVVPRA